MRIDAALQYGTNQLVDSSPSARLDAELLLAHCLGKPRSFLYAWSEKTITTEQQNAFYEALSKRAGLYPVAYLIGYQEFWSLNIKVTPDVLIPRADTELLVETALEKIATLNSPKVLELGTGSGAISLALATERQDSKITATDISGKALVIAKENQQSLHIENIHFLESDWFKSIPIAEYDLVISNPPYIDPADAHLDGSIRHEPLKALASDNKGLRDLKHIAINAPNYLSNKGWLIMEHGYDQGEQVSAILKQAAYQKISCLQDLGGNDRISMAVKSSNT